ncbi:MAG TPA: TIGR03617 family F420-dependent LLM class oxidoreductase [Mycobacteriales bacterium]|nr:TIGR03617 family F420-dependent LLM class oxidoreductase [Mycobacteriales bacterium]
MPEHYRRRLAVDTQLVAPLGQEDDAARRLKDLGFDGVFTFEGRHDVFFPLVAAARAGVGLELMTNVAIALPRSPIHLAHAAWDLQTLSGGRFRLGLGSQIKPQVERRYGARWIKPVAQMREWIEAIRAIFTAWETGERLDYRGDYTSHTLMTPMFNPGPNPHGPPSVLLGALGPRMTQLAAEVADGLLVMPFNSRRHLVERTLPAIDAGLAAAGRPQRGAAGDRFEIVAEIIVACGRDETELAAARAGARSLLAFYGSTPSYRPVLDAEGWGDVQPELTALSKQGHWTEMGRAIDDTMLATLAVVGSPSECAGQILERYGDVATRLAFYQPYPADPTTTGDLLAALRPGS